MLNDIGWTYCLLGDCDAHCGSLALQQEPGNRVEDAVTWDSLGYAHHIGEHPSGVRLLRAL